MRPIVSVLQLDTQFPRLPGDVACPDTYCGEVEIIRVTKANVQDIVRADPAAIDIAPFESALRDAKGDVIVTSCGFLWHWQGHLEAQTDRPFVSSSLVSLDRLSCDYAPKDLMILTFDAARLGAHHFEDYPRYQSCVTGLGPQTHLHEVISNDLTLLDANRARREIAEIAGNSQTRAHKRLLLECTNLPPYKAALHDATQLPIEDILTEIEILRPGSIQPTFL